MRSKCACSSAFSNDNASLRNCAEVMLQFIPFGLLAQSAFDFLLRSHAVVLGAFEVIARSNAVLEFCFGHCPIVIGRSVGLVVHQSYRKILNRGVVSPEFEEHISPVNPCLEECVA